MQSSSMDSGRASLGYFTGLADQYDAHRPTYPGDAFACLLEGLGSTPRVVDVGCGTGISSRLLAEHGAQVIGIDPNAQMLEKARQASSEFTSAIQFRVGTAEDTGIAEAAADLVLCAQSFHWFEPERALREFHRVLRVGGRLALMWNVKTTGNAFSVAYADTVRQAMADARTRGLVVPSERQADPTMGGCFGGVRRRVFPNPQTLDLQGVLGRARSASYFPREGALRRALEEQLQRAFEQSRRDGLVTLTHDTEVTLAERISF